MKSSRGLNRLVVTFTEMFGLGRSVAIGVILLVTGAMVFALFWFFHSAPPSTIIITSGPAGSVFQTTAERYRAILARSHVKLKILPSEGALDNLKRLSDRSARVDIGFVPGGLTNGIITDGLVSLGSIGYQPLLVFYRSATPVELLSQLNGKRLAIGPVGSGSRSLSLALLAVNGIEPGGATTLVESEGEDAARELLESQVDAAFLMADSTSTATMRKLLRTPGVELMSFAQADGYTRRIHFLNKLELPQGAIDFGKNIPAHDVFLLGPTVELVARANLHPAMSDLLLEAAREIHGRATLFQRRGEFPAPLANDFRISPDASRYYKSGKSFLYRYLPFWLASQLNRILIVFVPMLVVLIPSLRSIPAMYRWQVRLRLYRWYRALLTLEGELLAHPVAGNRADLLARLDAIEVAVKTMKVPASFADQFYGLRGHIDFVRSRLAGHAS